MDQAAGGPDGDTAGPAFSVGSGSYPPPFKYTNFIYIGLIFSSEIIALSEFQPISLGLS
jgi:hypothetical protein